MLGLKLVHVDKRGPRNIAIIFWRNCYISCESMELPITSNSNHVYHSHYIHRRLSKNDKLGIRNPIVFTWHAYLYITAKCEKYTILWEKYNSIKIYRGRRSVLNKCIAIRSSILWCRYFLPLHWLGYYLHSIIIESGASGLLKSWK